MDLKQTKLTKSEWETIEVPVSENEMEILRLIVSGYNEVNIKYNHTHSLFTYLKIDYNEQMEDYLYNKFFSEKIQKIIHKYENIKHLKIEVKPNITIKKSDQIRLSRSEVNSSQLSLIYEFILIEHIEKLIYYKNKTKKNWLFHYFTLHKLLQNNIQKLNKHIELFAKKILDIFENDVSLLDIIHNSVEYIEKNVALLKYNDMTLYEHQKEIFTVVKNIKPKLVLYIAPTGTGKTLTPLGLSENHKVIFVCAARHVGLALARAAISIHKKVAFAFGCSSADDIRLHYFAAKDYTVNKRTGGIKKVDNSVGDKVEIMICDIRSYLQAMYYMLAFHSEQKIITYWDEPTITLDYTNHELHSIIKKNWKDNLIPNMVLSSATLPKLHELTETIFDFKEKFPGCIISNIVSNDCRKTIPIINNNGYVVMPHNISDTYEEVLDIVKHCQENATLLRYFDLKEASEFIHFVETNDYIKSQAKISRNFGCIGDVDMKSIKTHYLKTLKNILEGKWSVIYNFMKMSTNKRVLSNDTVDNTGNKIIKANSIGPGITTRPVEKDTYGVPITRLASEHSLGKQVVNSGEKNGSSGIYITTKDAHTLTDGPTIFLAKDVGKIAKFCIQQANIPSSVMNDIMEKIEYNNKINEKIDSLEQEIEDEIEKNGNKKSDDGTHKNTKKESNVSETKDKKVLSLQEQLDTLRNMIKHAKLNDLFIPNKLTHLKKWAEGIETGNVFTSDIEEDTIISIMQLKNVEDSWKVLLLLGIGVFTQHKNITYTEIMKKMADQQKLYMIIADSDYIYGTNYQFCHGYLSKDMELTQEKIIQAMGRIGRNNIQQEYSIRFRDDAQIKMLFTSFKSEEKPEVINMNVLLNSKNVMWDGKTFVYVE